ARAPGCSGFDRPSVARNGPRSNPGNTPVVPPGTDEFRDRRPSERVYAATGTRSTPMASITASMFMALDGVVAPEVGNWHFPYFNEEMGEAVTATHDADVMLFGRVTYDSFAGAWPEREQAGEADA